MPKRSLKAVKKAFDWRPLGWEAKEPQPAASFSTAAESFDSNPPPGVFVVTAPSYTDSSVDYTGLVRDFSEDLELERELSKVSQDPWLELAGEKRSLRNLRVPIPRNGRNLRVHWADDDECCSIPASW